MGGGHLLKPAFRDQTWGEISHIPGGRSLGTSSGYRLTHPRISLNFQDPVFPPPSPLLGLRAFFFTLQLPDSCHVPWGITCLAISFLFCHTVLSPSEDETSGPNRVFHLHPVHPQSQFLGFLTESPTPTSLSPVMTPVPSSVWDTSKPVKATHLTPNTIYLKDPFSPSKPQ